MSAELAKKEERGTRRRTANLDRHPSYIRIKEQNRHKGMDIR